MINIYNFLSKIRGGVSKFLMLLTAIGSTSFLQGDDTKNEKKEKNKITLSISAKGNKKISFANDEPDPTPGSGIKKLGLGIQNNITLDVSMANLKIEANIANLLLDKFLLDFSSMKAIAIAQQEGKNEYQGEKAKIASYAVNGFLQAITNMYLVLPVFQDMKVHIGQINKKMGLRLKVEGIDSVKLDFTLGNTFEKVSKKLLNLLRLHAKAENKYVSGELDIAPNILHNKDAFRANPLALYPVDAWIIPTLTLQVKEGVLGLANLDSIIDHISISYKGPNEHYSYIEDKYKKEGPQLELSLKSEVKFTDNLTCTIKPKITRKYEKNNGDYTAKTSINVPLDIKFKRITLTLEAGTDLVKFKPKAANIGITVKMKEVLYEEEEDSEQE